MSATYEPFGDDWKKEVMRLPKVELVKLYAAACLKSQSLEQQLRDLLRDFAPRPVREWTADDYVKACELAKGGAR